MISFDRVTDMIASTAVNHVYTIKLYYLYPIVRFQETETLTRNRYWRKSCYKILFYGKQRAELGTTCLSHLC